jgi:alpha-L-fucosidase
MNFRKMARTLLLGACVLAGQRAPAAGEAHGPEKPRDPVETPAQRDARMAWWRAARFGMFIHWNVSSVPAGVYHGKNNHFVGEWIMHDEKIPVVEYRSYAERFNPVKFNAEKWVLLAKAAGMKYIVITAKHHDGFAMYHSKVSEWNIRDATPFKRDPLKELSEACQKHDIRLGFYYSQAQDWNHPGGAVPGGIWDPAQKGDMDEYLDKISIPQLREILTGYGKVSILWFDSPYEMNPERADKVYSVLKLQPGIIINDRLGGGYLGDAASPEQDVPANGVPGRDFEACMTMNDTWGYKSTDHNWKPRGVLLRHLVNLASKGGNYLLNVGPTAEGVIPEPSVERLKQVGEWLAVNGDAIYSTSAGPFTQQLPWGRCTQRVGVGGGTTLFFHVFQWPSDGELAVPGLKTEVEAAYLLADPEKESLPAVNTAAGLTITVPVAAPDKDVSVVVVRLRGSVEVGGQ